MHRSSFFPCLDFQFSFFFNRLQLQLLRPRGNARLHLIQPFNKLCELCPTLVLELILVTAEDGLEDRDQSRREFADGWVFPFVYDSGQHMSH